MSIQSLMNADPAICAYIGCMTGTSADKQADFSIAIFDKHQLSAHINHSITLPESLRLQLLKLSTTPISDIDSKERSDVEFQFTQFLSHAFTTLIKMQKLDHCSPSRIILSPHGQTIDHRPDMRLTDQLVHGEQLAYETRHPVVFRHRQACIHLSQAAPLVPVFLQTLPLAQDTTHVFINGGGVANICIMQPGQPIQAFDTGPANGPIDAMVAHLLDQHKTAIPSHLYSAIADAHYDVGGELAACGHSCNQLKSQLLQHAYFQADHNNLSIDRCEFGLEWLLALKSTLPILDQFKTLCEAVTDSIVLGIRRALPSCNTACQLWVSGGIRHNTALKERLITKLEQHYPITTPDWDSIHLNPDYLESLMMAYLGMCVHQKKTIDLSYCLRPGATINRAIPGVLAEPVTDYV